MKIIVTGGRDYQNAPHVFRTLFALSPSHIVVGDASGVDAFATSWASHNCEVTVYKADWKAWGKAAGPIRNAKMLSDHADDAAFLLAFPGGKGTANCVEQAKGMDILVLRAEPKEQEQEREWERCRKRANFIASAPFMNQLLLRVLSHVEGCEAQKQIQNPLHTKDLPSKIVKDLKNHFYP